jgi:hypothetical protein
MPLELAITSEEKIHVSLDPKTQSGKPATLDGTPTWEVISGNGTVVADENGLGAYLVSGDAVDTVVYRVSADADLGQGVRTIEDTITVTVTNAEAAALGLTAGAAEPK